MNNLFANTRVDFFLARVCFLSFMLSKVRKLRTSAELRLLRLCDAFDNFWCVTFLGQPLFPSSNYVDTVLF